MKVQDQHQIKPETQPCQTSVTGCFFELPFSSKLNKEEEFWFVRWIFMRRKYKNALIEIENLKTLEISKLQAENKRLEKLLIQLRTDMFPENKTKRKYKNGKK
jgi:hypothetical protein